ncbi:glycosyltransferase [Lactiplantibacillus plantarum]|uniref:glycosyltransferase n=1 Tax=Lactiplantibacillus plantarum TaxID=1590 RepID=UPI0013150585|nr:glycosyltransferase [Lactiplantibacillus plantarum]
MHNMIAILLSSYNGEIYIREQIETIINQTNYEWDLFIRDDGSTDKTLDVINYFVKKYEHIHLVQDDLGNIGPLRSFKELLTYANDFQYVMFCDQDDIWKRDKIEVTLKKMLTLEKKDNFVLVYTNYEIKRQAKLTTAYQSNMQAVSIANNILVQSWLMGCTMMMNNNLASFACDIPIVAENHDNWYAKVAALIADIGYVHETTMIHQLHDHNVTSRLNSSNKIVQLKSLISWFKTRNEEFDNQYSTIIELRELCQKKVKSLKTEKVMNNYIKMFQKKNVFSKLSLICQNKFRAYALNQNIKFLIIVLFGKRTRSNNELYRRKIDD